MFFVSRARLGGLFGTLSLFACGDPGPLFVPLPPADPGGSIVFALPDTSVERYFALDAAEGPTPANFSAEGSSVEAYVYEERLEPLRIPSGALSPSSAASPLPTPQARFVLSLEDDAPSWVESAQAEALDALRIELNSPCFEFEVERSTLTPGRPIFVDPLPDGRFLHGSKITEIGEIELTIIDLDGRLEAAGSIDTADFWTGGVFGDRLWLSDGSGGIHFAPLSDMTHTSSHSTTLTREIVRDFLVDGDPSAASLTITAITGGGTIERYDGSAWRVVRAQPPNTNDEGSLLRLPDGAYLGAVPLFRYVLHEKDGVVTEEAISGSGGPLVLGFLNGEPVVSLTSGELFARRGAVWVPLGTPPAAVEIYAYTDFADGFFLAGTGGLFSEWNRELDAFCPPISLEGYSGITQLHRLGDRILVAGNPTRNRYPAPVDFVRPLRR